jgi:tRNA(fMet)-specific endonuclease VapC
MFILDTDLISIIQRRSQPAYGRLYHRMNQHAPGAFYVTIVSFHEQSIGAHARLNRARTPAELVDGYDTFEMVRFYFRNAQVLPFDLRAATLFHQLRPQHQRLGAMDLRIAAIALVHNYAVLTRNLRDFHRVPNLIAQDWTT